MTNRSLSNYLIAAGASMLSLLLTLLLNSHVNQSGLLLLFAAVVVSCWRGGFRAGVLSTFLSAVLAFFFLPPAIGSGFQSQNIVRLAIFVAAGLLASWLISSLTSTSAALRLAHDEMESLVAKRTAELAREQDLLHVLMDNIPDAIYFKDRQSRFIRVNRAEAEMLGTSNPEDAVGKTDFDYFPADRAEEFFEDEKKLFDSGQPLIGKLERIVKSNGQTRWVSTTKVPIHDQQGEVAGLVGITRDVTERHQMQEALLRAHEELEARVQQRTSELSRANLSLTEQMAERRHAEAALRQSEERFRLLVERVEDYAIYMLDINGRIASWNIGAERIKGYTADEAMGQHFSIFYTGEDRAQNKPEKMLEKAIAGGRSEDEGWRVRKDGSLFWANVSITALTDEVGKLRGFSEVTRDITERKRAEEERAQLLVREQEARMEAEAANRAKDDFLATVSHELRTPLNSVLGWTRMLSSGKLDEEMINQAVETIDRSARSQVQLIEDLLDTSRIIAGKLRLEPRPVELGPIVKAAVDSLRPQAQARSVDLQVSIEAEQCVVSGDPDRLQQVVWNLVSNAIKFTPENGSVTVRLITNGTHAQVTITDTGIGISPDFLPHVFDRFRQADSASRRQGGLGLGLALVHQLVTMHGGTVSADSPGEDLGSTFSVMLPLITSLPARQEDSHPALSTH